MFPKWLDEMEGRITDVVQEITNNISIKEFCNWSDNFIIHHTHVYSTRMEFDKHLRDNLFH
jgi:hypothetical protein